MASERQPGNYWVRNKDQYGGNWAVGYWDGAWWYEHAISDQYSDQVYAQIGPRAGCVEHSDVATNTACPRCGQVWLVIKAEGAHLQ